MRLVFLIIALAGCSKPNLKAVWLHGYETGKRAAASQCVPAIQRAVSRMSESCQEK